YRNCINQMFLNHVDIDIANTHVPDGMAPDLPQACADYERAIKASGGIDLQILGIGSDGHIGFNEPSSSLGSRTRVKTLTDETRRDKAPDFEGNPDAVPHHVVTMGIGTIMEARTCLLIAFGKRKRAAVVACIEGPVTAMVPASALQFHPDAKIVLDSDAA